MLTIFTFILTGRTMIVTAVSLFRTDDEITERIEDLTAAQREKAEEARKLVEAARETLGKDELKTDVGRFLAKLGTDLSVDVVVSEFQNYLERSREAATTAQRRPNALLFVGTLIAVVGLLFFIVTLPGSRFGLLRRRL